MGIVKHGQRTVRKGCDKCGSKDLYWGHDTSIADEHCDKCGVNGKWVLIDRDENPHILTCSGAAGRYAPKPAGPATPNTPKDPSVSVATAPVVPAPAPTAPAAPAAAPDALAAFQTLMSAMTPTLDREQIAAMIKEEFASAVFPTRTVVERLDGTVKPIQGTTHYRVADVLRTLNAREHCMMVGPAGTGKSTIAEQCAEARGVAYYAMSLSPQTSAPQILGYQSATGDYIRSLFREAYEHGGVFHFDEIDNGNPSTLALINAALANGSMGFPDGMVKRHDDFRCVASANTYGKGADRAYVGRQQLDAATLDRFTIRTIEIDEALETDLCMSTGLDTDTVTRVLTTVRQYRANAVAKRMSVVISPRASVGMCRLLVAGDTWDDALEARVRRGMSDQDWQKLTNA